MVDYWVRGVSKPINLEHGSNLFETRNGSKFQMDVSYYVMRGSHTPIEIIIIRRNKKK